MAQTYICQNCQSRSSKRTGKKISMQEFINLKQIRSPRNQEQQHINLIDYIRTRRKKPIIEDSEMQYESQGFPTHKQKTDVDTMIDSQIHQGTTTSRLDQIPISQHYQKTVVSKVKSSAFYLMKQSRNSSRQFKKRNLEIGPIFSQVSKYVHRPQTVRSFNEPQFLFEDEQYIPKMKRMLSSCKSEIRLPVSNKLSEVRAFMKKEQN